MNRRVVGFALKLAIPIATIAFLLSTQKLQISQLAIRPGGWGWALAAGLLLLLQMIVIQVRFALVLRAGDIAVSLGRVIRIGLVSWFLNALMLGGFGFVGADTIRAAYVMRDQQRRPAIVVAALLDRVVGLVMLLVIVCLSALIGLKAGIDESRLGTTLLLLYAALYAVGVAILMLLTTRLFGRAVAAGVVTVLAVAAAVAAPFVLKTLSVGTIGPLVAVTLAAAAPALVDPSAMLRIFARIPYVGPASVAAVDAFLCRRGAAPLVASFACALVGHGLSLFAIFTLAHGVAIKVVPAFAQILFAAPIAFLTTAAPLPANGLGVGEIAFDALLRSSAPPGATVVTGGAALYLAFRMLGMVMALVGLPFFLTLRKIPKDAG